MTMITTKIMKNAAETFKGEPRTNTESAVFGTSKSLRANPNALEGGRRVLRIAQNPPQNSKNKVQGEGFRVYQLISVWLSIPPSFRIPFS